MRLSQRLSTVLLVSSLFASAAHAQAKIDTPIIREVDSSRSSLTVEVEAGATGAPSGFRVEWMKLSDYNANGGWPDSPSSPIVGRAVFYGFPTWNMSTGSYQLASGAKVTIELGDLFDETGFAANNVRELGDQQQYVIHVQAIGTATDQASDQSTDLQATTRPASQNCTFTQGYWKNHADAWPVDNLTLGTVNYTKAQLLQIFNQPAKGNGLVSLAHQLIAAKLNIANGADPTPVLATIAAADAQIGGLVVPPIGSGFLNPDDTDGNAKILDDYNNGDLGVNHCAIVRAQPSTWGNVKGMYR